MSKGLMDKIIGFAEKKADKSMEKYLEKHPDDQRGSTEYRSMVSAIRASDWDDKLSDIVHYACDQEGIEELKETLVYRMVAKLHQVWGNVGSREGEKTAEALERALNAVSGVTGAILGAAQGAGHIPGEEVDEVQDFLAELNEAYRSFLFEPEVNAQMLEVFYERLAPRIISELTEGPSDEYLKWEGSSKNLLT